MDKILSDKFCRKAMLDKILSDYVGQNSVGQVLSEGYRPLERRASGVMGEDRATRAGGAAGAPDMREPMMTTKIEPRTRGVTLELSEPWTLSLG